MLLYLVFFIMPLFLKIPNVCASSFMIIRDKKGNIYMTSRPENIEKYKNKKQVSKRVFKSADINANKANANKANADKENTDEKIVKASEAKKKFILSKREKIMRPHILEAAKKYKLSPGLLMAIIKAESDFQPEAISSQGAKGLMQLMDITAKEMLVSDVFEPRENIFAGAEYFSRLLKRYDYTIELALAGYNAGPTNVKKYNGIPPFKETKRYIRKVKKYWRYYRNF